MLENQLNREAVYAAIEAFNRQAIPEGELVRLVYARFNEYASKADLLLQLVEKRLCSGQS